MFRLNSPESTMKEPDAGSFFVSKIMSFFETNRPEQKRFYSSTKWRKLRKAYLAEHPLCERCLAVGRAQVAEHVHHKIELDESNYKNPMIALNAENLESLCFDCHQKEHHSLSECADDLYFDSDGNLRRK